MNFKVSKLLLLALTFSPVLFISVGTYIGRVISSPITVFSSSSEQNHHILGLDTSEDILGTPIRLVIQTIKVNASIESIGLTPSGEMGVPENPLNVGWFQIGNITSISGNAVISGHLNQADGKEGIFANLHRLKPGDDIFVEDNRGITTSFVVREIRVYNPDHAEDVFYSSDGVHLNLVTCEGTWDKNKKSYSKRLVVFTDLK